MESESKLAKPWAVAQVNASKSPESIMYLLILIIESKSKVTKPEGKIHAWFVRNKDDLRQKKEGRGLLNDKKDMFKWY